MPSYFLAVRFPLGVLWEDDASSDTVSLDTYPPGAYEEQPHVFYETDSESVAGELVKVFRRVGSPSGPNLKLLTKSPLVLEVVSTAGLDLTQCVLLREDLRKNLDRIEQVVSMSKDDWDPDGLADEGLPHDRRTFILVIYNKLAQQWEPLVREELGIRDTAPAQEGSGSGKARGAYLWFTWGALVPMWGGSDVNEKFYFHKTDSEDLAARLTGMFQENQGDKLWFGYTLMDEMDASQSILAEESIGRYQRGEVAGDDSDFSVTATRRER